MPENKPDTPEGAGVTLPKWFLWVVSGASSLFVGLFIPWGVWVTWSLMTLTLSLPASNKAVDQVNTLTSRMDRAEDRYAAGHKELEDRIGRLEVRVGKLEK